jgi:hypothetical protein
MNTNVKVGNPNPTATLAINKGRVKIYNNKSETPTYYLKKGQEFQIEVFNTTTDTVLAKIKLNNKLISQSGLVLKPGQRVFLDRFFDIDKKFKFDTYEVSGGDEVKQAIIDNGDVEVLFYREEQPYINLNTFNNTYGGSFGGPVHTDNTMFFSDMASTGGYVHDSVTNTNNITFTTTGSVELGTTTSNASLDVLKSSSVKKKSLVKKIKSNNIETGRVEQGATSNQKFDTVSLDFQSNPFHRVSYKLLPNSQKNVETQDLPKSYCGNCGKKILTSWSFCTICGNKL